MHQPTKAYLLVIVLPFACLIGCHARVRQARFTPTWVSQAHAGRDAAQLRTDPVRFLRDTLARCQRLHQYELTFFRQERLGLLLKSFQPLEKMRVRFRDEPFSVKFVWLSEGGPYLQSAYVRGCNDGRILVLERKGLLGLPPAVRAYDVLDPVRWQKARNPVTDFGLARMLERTLAKLDEADQFAELEVSYQGLVRMEVISRDAHHVEIHYPPADPFPHPKQDLFIDASSRLPAGTYLWLPNDQLDAMYLYADVDTFVELTDEDFAIASPAGRSLSREAPRPHAENGRHGS